MRLATIVLAAAVCSATLHAQWPAFVRADVPRMANGQPDLNAPAPRLATGKPDFTGVWESRVPPSGRLGGRMVPNVGEGPPLATFFDLGANVPGGLPFTPWAAELRKQRMASNSKDNPDANCLPVGFMQQNTHSQPRRIVHTKDDLVIIYEANQGLRQIFTDGRTLPPADANPTWEGYSVGRWDGDTMVVESMGFRDDGWLDVNGAYFGNTTKVTERFRRVNYGRMEIDMTVEDPRAYTKPFTVRVNWRLYPEGQLIEFVCNENQRFVAR